MRIIEVNNKNNTGIGCEMMKDVLIFNVITHPKYRSNGFAKYWFCCVQQLFLLKPNSTIIGFKGNVDIDNELAIKFYIKYGAKLDTNFAYSSQPNDENQAFRRLKWYWNTKDKSALLQEIETIKRNIVTRYIDNHKRVKKQLKYCIFGVFVLVVVWSMYRNFVWESIFFFFFLKLVNSLSSSSRHIPKSLHF